MNIWNRTWISIEKNVLIVSSLMRMKLMATASMIIVTNNVIISLGPYRFS